VNYIRGRPKPIYAHSAVTVTGPKLKISVKAVTVTRPKLRFQLRPKLVF